MALKECPHMVARCPHHNNECNEKESIDCHFIKNSTATAIYTIALLKGAPLEMQEEFGSQTENLSEFLNKTLEKQKN